MIFDESFIDFSDIKKRYTFIDEDILNANKNFIVIKSISKSYGVPGLRLGVLVSSNSDFISKIKKTNAIWNINSFAEYFLQIYDKYKKLYVSACDSIVEERNRFISELGKFKELEVFPSEANYLMCRLTGKMNATSLTETLLSKYNIFIKDLSSKKCFESGMYIRIAVRDRLDDDMLVKALSEIFNN